MAENRIIDLGIIQEEKKKILVIDDEPSLQSLIHDMLGEDYRLIQAFNGREGLARAENTQPDLILTDMMMPDLTGYDVAKILNGNIKTKNIPVVIITAKNFDPTTVQFFKSEPNVVAMIAKPFRVQQLREAVIKALTTKLT